MPFDGKEEKVLARQRGYQLADALRNLPKSHIWEFWHLGGKTVCGSVGCAIGLAETMWPETLPEVTIGVSGSEFDHFFGLPEGSYGSVFGVDLALKHQIPMAEVTPEMVADALEEKLNEGV